MNNILIVEDEHLIARLIEMTLTRAGYRCTLAEDGRTAADLIETTNFDMALLDIMLPGLDGYALLECLRPQGVPVIFITAKSAVKDRVQGLRLGADDYITKPGAAGGSCAPTTWCWTRSTTPPVRMVSLWSCAAWNTICWSF